MTDPSPTLPNGAHIPRGRQKPRWRRKLRTFHNDGQWHLVETMGKTSAYQTALKNNAARRRGALDYELACRDTGDRSELWIRYSPLSTPESADASDDNE